MESMRHHWKKVRSAFMGLNVDKQGCITRAELWNFFSSWGLSDAQFETLFNKFDKDQDGEISYEDFNLTIGHELYPSETLYFR